MIAVALVGLAMIPLLWNYSSEKKVSPGQWQEANWGESDQDSQLVTLADLVHNSPELSARMRRCDAKARELAASTWYHAPYVQRGNYVRAGWSTHVYDRGRVGWPWQRPPQGEARFVSVGTLCYPQRPHSVFGIELEAEYVPAGNGWAARVTYHDDAGAHIYGAAASVIFFRRGQLYEEGILVALPIDQVPQTLATPESLRDFAIGQIEEQRKSYEEALAADVIQYSKPDMAKYRGDGIPPPKVSRPYIPAEKQKLLADRRTQDESNIEVLREHHQEMYQAVKQAFPLHECW